MQTQALKVAHDQAAQKYLSVQDVARRYGVTVRSVWRWTRESNLPAPVQLGSGGASRWVLAELERWESAKAAERAGRG